MDAKRELEKVICDKCPDKNHCVAAFGNSFCRQREDTAQAILDRLPEMGFVRLDDVQIDVNELTERLMVFKIHTYSYEWTRREYKKLAHAICQAKGIIKIKEGK